jgi:hypothetical protein
MKCWDSRRPFDSSPRLCRLCAAVVLLVYWEVLTGAAAAAPATPGAPSTLPSADRAELLQTVRRMGERYDPKEHMIRRPFSSPGYHTTLKGGFVHPTRDSLNYAIALLDTGDPELEKRAEDILRKVISLQDQNPESRTYGIWSWFLEEPLDKMSPPDWNWADFCGVQLLQVALYHRSELPADLAERVDAAIRHAARSIQRRNMAPDYTNIAIMGTYVTLVTAEFYDVADLREYAMQRLRRFYDYTKEQGAFSEYNSPTYTVVALQEIGRLRLQAKDPEARRMADELYHRAWEEIAVHFHPPTAQWAGPHSRCYETLLRSSTAEFLQHALEGKVRILQNDPPRRPEEYRLPLACPPDLVHYFARLDQPRGVVETFVKREMPIVGTTWLAPAFTLGSVNRGDLWNQRRSLVAYWGTTETPSYLHLRFLHDSYDFADAMFLSAQHQGTLVGGVVLATDGGDTHISLDKIKNHTIRAGDLRLRFEFGGAAGLKPFAETPAQLDAPIRLGFGGLHVDLRMLFARFNNKSCRLQSGFDPREKLAWIEVVFYSGEPREFRLDELEQAAAGFYLRLAPDKSPLPEVQCALQDGSFKLGTIDPALELNVPIKPASVSELLGVPVR